MSKIPIYILEVDKPAYEAVRKLNYGLTLMEVLGSEPKEEGSDVEGHIVPSGKVWLCPSGNGYAKLEAIVQGKRLMFHVTL